MAESRLAPLVVLGNVLQALKIHTPMKPFSSDHISPARVLWLIREGKARSNDDLYRELIPLHQLPGSPAAVLFTRIDHIVKDLIAAGLIARGEKGTLATTAQLKSLQAALGLSLSLLSEVGPQSLVVNPLFGKPDPASERIDIFVIMPFGSEFRPVFDECIKAVATKLRLTVARGDDFFTTHSIVQDIWSGICNCRLVIADCTGKNANVFYEIGIAHAIGKPTILLAQTVEDIPFDLRHHRSIVYEPVARGQDQFRSALEQTIANTLRAEA